jgi:AmiR/NasT family two-component response regulator
MSDTRILLAEDETITRMDLREMLENLGYDVVGEAGDGAAAVNLARTLKPDLVLMDIKMPGVDGISAAETLVQEHVSPVLLLTAYSDKEFIDRAVDAGVMGYLVKPFLEAQLKPRWNAGARCARSSTTWRRRRRRSRRASWSSAPKAYSWTVRISRKPRRSAASSG